MITGRNNMQKVQSNNHIARNIHQSTQLRAKHGSE